MTFWLLATWQQIFRLNILEIQVCICSTLTEHVQKMCYEWPRYQKKQNKTKKHPTLKRFLFFFFESLYCKTFIMFMRTSFFKSHNIIKLIAEGTIGLRMKCFKEFTEVLTPILQIEGSAIMIFCPSQQKPVFSSVYKFMGLAWKQASAYRSVTLHTSCLVYINIQKTLSFIMWNSKVSDGSQSPTKYTVWLESSQAIILF